MTISPSLSLRFRIDAASGIITIAHRLDYEKEKSYKLVIGVRDKGVPQLIGKKNATVDINILDCNDNVPIFQHPNYDVWVAENAAEGTLFLLILLSHSINLLSRISVP